jgi:hypothetical protein
MLSWFDRQNGISRLVAGRRRAMAAATVVERSSLQDEHLRIENQPLTHRISPGK